MTLPATCANSDRPVLRYRALLCGMLVLLHLHAAPDPRLLDRLFHTYLPTIHTLITGHLQLDDRTRAGLTAHSHVQLQLRLLLDTRGAVRRVVLTQSSGVRNFDRACQRAAEAIGILPELPSELRNHGMVHGLDVTFGTR